MESNCKLGCVSHRGCPRNISQDAFVQQEVCAKAETGTVLILGWRLDNDPNVNREEHHHINQNTTTESRNHALDLITHADESIV